MLQLQEAKTRKELRPHQQLAIELLRSSLGKGNKRVVLQGPTGFGKTLVASRIVENARAKGRRVIFTAPAISLIDQTLGAFEAEGLDDIGVMQSQHQRTDPRASLQIASVQTLARREIPEAGLVIVDECHISSSVIDSLMDDRPDLYFIGLSATPWRLGMGKRWQDLCIPITISQLIEQGYLSRFRVYAPTIPDLGEVKIKAGEYVEAQLAAVMGDAKLMGDVVQNWLAHGENRPTLCFGVNKSHACDLMLRFQRCGVAAAYRDAFTDIVERATQDRAFRRGEIKVICSVRTMTTGVDLPVSCIIDAGPTRSEMLHVQKIGRGLRVNPGTEDLIVFDHAGNTHRLGLVTDICHSDFVTAESRERAAQARIKRGKEPYPCVGCGVMHCEAECPACGKERGRRLEAIETVAGELSEVLGNSATAAARREDSKRFYGMALHLAITRGKSDKYAAGLFFGKFGEWPPKGWYVQPIQPDRAFLNYEKSRRIAYAKRMGAKDAA